MLRCIILLIFSLLANCDKDFDDGPCPAAPKIQKNLKFEQLAGVWKVVETNDEEIKSGGKECFEGIIKKVNGKPVMDLTLETSNSKTGRIQFSTLHVDSHFVGESTVKDSSGKSVSHVWNFSAVKLQDNGVLVHVCKQVGNKHKIYYNVALKKFPIDKATVDSLKEEYKEIGDPRPMHPVKIDDCVWKW